MENVKMTEPMAEAVKVLNAMGYEVYARPTCAWHPDEKKTYAYYTDGLRVAYIQHDGAEYSINTVHRPHSIVGTGYRVHTGDLNDFALARALWTAAPAWDQGNLRFVVKYRNFDDWHYVNAWNAGFVRVGDAIKMEGI